MTLEDHIAKHAAHGGATAIACGGERITYSRLFADVARMANELGGGRRVVAFPFKPCIESIERYLSIHLCDCVAAPMPKDATHDQLERAAQRFAHCLLPADAADILFTTGSTGKPKAVVWGNDTIVANAENLIAGQGFTPGLNFVVSGPLNHIGSLSKIQATLIAGATLWIADGLRDINGFYDMMERCEGKVATFLVPASIRILLQLGRERLGRLADKVAFIETGAAPIAQTDMLALCATLPQSRLYNTYASTETGIVASYDFNDGHCEAGCVGRVLKNALLRVDDDGTLACGGRSIMLGYADDETLTSETLRGGFVHTHDVGRVGSDGMLRLAGRNDDIINVGGYKVNPAEVEEAAMGDNQVADCVCVGVAHPVTGHALKLWVVTTNGRPLDKRALALALRSKLENHQVPQLYEQTDSIRRTFNGKLDRESYKAAQPSLKD